MAGTKSLFKLFSMSVIFASVYGAKILFISHIPSPSHFYVFSPVIEELSVRNHSLTLLTYNFLKRTDLNVEQLPLKALIQERSARMKSIVHDIAKISISRLKDGIVPFAKATCKNLLTDESTKTLLSKSARFDLVVIDGLIAECAAALGSVLGKNIIIFYSSGLIAWRPTSAPEPKSFVPNHLELLPSKMTFWQRFYNVFSYSGIRYVQEFYMTPAQQEVVSKYLPNAPNIEEAMKRVAFHITNADPVLQSPQPSMPNIAHCGSLHVSPAKSLPKDLNDFVESSGKEGFIIFGLGSNLKFEYLPADFMQAILSAFSRLKQKVVWKSESQIQNVPTNVKIVNWMPQRDLLGHRKCRLFITHGGLLSLQEAVYHEVPVITIPIYAEQPGNAARAVEIGIGEHISLLNITADGLHGLITKVLNRKSYLENVKKYSSILKDQPQKPVDKAVFWIEYVIRHDGAHHLRSAGDELNFFQYFLLDVIATLGIISLLILVLIKYALRLCSLKLWSLKNSDSKNIKKKLQ